MSVIVELSLPSDEFELGRILRMDTEMTISLETMVPLGGRPIPMFRRHNSMEDAFEQHVRNHPAVNALTVVHAHDDEILYALDWTISNNTFFDQITSLDGHLLDATGSAASWGFELRFPSHNALSVFQDHCHDSDIPINVKRIYNPTKPDAGPWYGLTTGQREMLLYAVEAGYYAIPRELSTQDLADEFDISDQAVTERLRRAISTLVNNTVLLSAESEEDHERSF